MTASREHGSFRVELDGRPYMVFSSETSNNWYLILSVDTSALYGESYRQMAVMASVNLLMLAVVAVYCVLSSRRTRRAEESLSETRRGVDGFSLKLRESAAHLLRLGDIRLFREGEDPSDLSGRSGIPANTFPRWPTISRPGPTRCAIRRRKSGTRAARNRWKRPAARYGTGSSYRCWSPC